MNKADKTPEQLMEELRNTQWTIERQLLPEPDLHLIALEQAGKLKNDNIEQLLGRAEEIEKWLREPERLKTEARKKNFETHQEMMEKLMSK